MTRTENDLRDALHELARRADEHGAPSAGDILSLRPDGRRHGVVRRIPRWLPPLAAAAAVAAVAVTAVALTSSGSSPSPRHNLPVAGSQPGTRPAVPHAHRASTTEASTTAPPSVPPAVEILGSAASQLETSTWTAPSPREFYYVHTNQATSWISVSGTRAGKAYNSKGVRGFNAACRNGDYINGESGKCTINDVPHYLADAPTDPAAWDAYLEHLSPGAKAADAQGKIIVEVLHQDLTAPKAAAALLRYTGTCPGLHTVVTRPVAGEKLVGVTCTSMTNGSYGLALDAGTDAFVGFVPVDYQTGRQSSQAEIIRNTGVVTAVGDRP